jgi:hypothetical protein
MLECWDKAFSGCEPIGHQLKLRFAERWIRFHSLPESKRYPETEAEFEVLLERFNAVVAGVAQPDSQLVLLTTEFAWNATSEAPPNPQNCPKYWRSIVVDEAYWHIWTTQFRWQLGALDSLVREVAVDAISNVIICDPDCRWAIHPYDGGIDVIAAAPSERDRLRTTFPEWLSSLPSGL